LAVSRLPSAGSGWAAADLPGDSDAVCRSVYEAALQPELWPPLLERLARRLGAGVVAFTWTDRIGTVHFAYASQPGSMGLFAGRPQDFVTKVLARLVSLRRSSDSPLRQGAASAIDVRRIIGENVVVDEASSAVLSAYRSRLQPPFSRRHRAFLAWLSPHLRQAARIMRRLGDATEEGRIALAVVERLDHGVFVVGSAGRVVHVNAAGLALCGDGLATCGGRLAARSADDDVRLQRAIAEATAAGEGRAGRWDCPLRVSRASGEAAYEVTVGPLGEGVVPGAGGARRPMAVVFVTDPSHEMHARTAELARVFGLTPAEVAVVLVIARGQGLGAVERELRISRNTAKTHLQRAFQKTETRRQAQLARLVERMAYRRPDAFESSS
jgi:DNA-binding CsgD family transcriptional regulator